MNMLKEIPVKTSGSPTTVQYASFQKIFSYFNTELFSNMLPDCLLSFSRDKACVVASFRRKRWFGLQAENDVIYHEISLNPCNLNAAKQQVLCSDIVHEMCHAWQYEYGKPGRNGYHNKQWAHKMVEVGLQPFNLRKPEIGTGDAVNDKIIPGGRFETAFRKMPAEYLLPLNCIEAFRMGGQGREKGPRDEEGSVTECDDLPAQVLSALENDSFLQPVKPTRFRYSCSCPGKEQKNIWGKPGLSGIRCEDCGELFFAENREGAFPMGNDHV